MSAADFAVAVGGGGQAKLVQAVHRLAAERIYAADFRLFSGLLASSSARAPSAVQDAILRGP